MMLFWLDVPLSNFHSAYLKCCIQFLLYIPAFEFEFEIKNVSWVLNNVTALKAATSSCHTDVYVMCLPQLQQTEQFRLSLVIACWYSWSSHSCQMAHKSVTDCILLRKITETVWKGKQETLMRKWHYITH